MKKNLTVKEVKQLLKDNAFNAVGILSKLTRRKDKNGNPFWEITISDQTGDLDGKVWQNSNWWSLEDNNKIPLDPENLMIGSSVGVQGKVAEFRDMIQFNFNDVFYLDQDKYPPQNFSRHSALKFEFLEIEFNKIIDEVSEPLHSFLSAVFFKHGLWNDFKIWPAAVSLHHAYSGGLLEHSLSVAIGARDIAKHYKYFNIPIDINLVIAGALLHDIGKIEMYTASSTPLVTTEGNVIEHIILGHHKFMSLAEIEKLDKKYTLAIAHIIVSHPGRREYGSPVLPAMPEAMIISAADDLDFKLSYWSNQIESLNEQNDVTDFLPMIERRLWRGI